MKMPAPSLHSLEKLQLSPQLQLIIACSKASPEEIEVAALRSSCQQVVDWPRFYRLCIAHDVYPRVFRQLPRLCQDLIPASVIADMRERVTATSARNLQLTQTLIAVLRFLTSNQLDVVPFKGPVMTTLLWGDPGMRRFRDLDILVPRSQVTRAVALLHRGMGFVPLCELSNAQMEKLILTDKELPMVHPETGICIDLQWELTGGFWRKQLTFQSLSQDFQQLDFYGEKITVFSHSDLLFYLCLHATQHMWQKIEHVCSLHRLLRRETAWDWQRLAAMSFEYGAGKALGTGISLVARLFDDVKLPSDLWSHLFEKRNQGTLSASVVRAMEQYGEGRDRVKMISTRYAFRQYHFFTNNSQAIRYTLHLLFVPTRYDWQVFHPPGVLWWTLYLMRPFRLLITVFKNLYFHLIGDAVSIEGKK